MKFFGLIAKDGASLEPQGFAGFKYAFGLCAGPSQRFD
jgi:hypothetical protein